LLAHVASFVGDPQVRHRGTIGGSLAHGDARVRPPGGRARPRRLDGAARSLGRARGGRRRLLQGFLETALEPDELLVEIRVPRMPGAGFSYQKFVKRAQDWAIVGAAVVRSAERTGVGLVNMGSVPLRAAAVEEALASGASVADAAGVADEGTSPSDDLNASEDFRRHLARVLVRRGLEEASPA
jgi:carbon-monoxide dehydrogenase medium subunit